MFSKNLEVCPHDSFHCHKKWRAITGRLTHGIWCKVCCEIVGGWRTSRQHGNHTINFEHSFRHVEIFGVVYLQFKYTLFPVEYDSFELLTVSEDNVKICIIIQLQMTMLFMVEYDKKNVSMIVSEDNEISWFIFNHCEDCWSSLKIYILKTLTWLGFTKEKEIQSSIIVSGSSL